MYTDPGIGSILLQVFVGIITAIPVLIALYFGKLKKIFKRGKTNGPKN
jgi:hypothetical protein